VGGAVLAALLVAFAVLAAAGPAQALSRKSYTFMGLEWGTSLAAARAQLTRAGFRVEGGPVEGPQPEFAVSGMQASLAAVDRGTRLVAVGRFAGQPIRVDLAFGKEDRLRHVILTSQYWDGTIPGARTLVDLSTRLVMYYEERYGAATKHKGDGWIDTALWPRAADGSELGIFVRGVEGFMFSPSFKTALRVDFVSSRAAAGARIELPPPGYKPPAKPKLLTKEQLRKEYSRNPAEVEPPPPPGKK
jgi:hypothetical protein